MPVCADDTARSRSTSPGKRATTPIGAAARRRPPGVSRFRSTRSPAAALRRLPPTIGARSDGRVYDDFSHPAAESACGQLSPGRRHGLPAIANIGCHRRASRRRHHRPGATAIPVTSAVGYGTSPAPPRSLAAWSWHRQMRRLPQPARRTRDQSQQQHAGLRHLPQPGIDRRQRAANADCDDARNRPPMGADDRLQAHDPRDS